MTYKIQSFTNLTAAQGQSHHTSENEAAQPPPREEKKSGNLSTHRQNPYISIQTLFCVISALFFLCCQPISLQKQQFGEVQVFGGSCGGTLGRAEYHRLTRNSGVEKKHLVSVVNWTKEDESLGCGKGWAEGRVAGYHYLQPQSALCL